MGPMGSTAPMFTVPAVATSAIGTIPADRSAVKRQPQLVELDPPCGRISSPGTIPVERWHSHPMCLLSLAGADGLASAWPVVVD
jgi:hypothetical protein